MTRSRSTTLGALAITGALACSAHDAEQATGWQLAGRLGMLQFIIVPEASARDRAYYDSVIRQSCEEGATCFMRFFTNSRHLPVAMPLPDAIYAEPTAMYQRSAKQAGREGFRFSCRLGLPDDGCF